MKYIFAIDPGTTESALLVYDPKERRVRHGLIADNQKILNELYALTDANVEAVEDSVLVIERLEHYGKSFPIGMSVLETARWSGRFEQQYWIHSGGKPVVYIPRRDVKLYLCNTSRADDAGVRLALLDKFGGSMSAAKGTAKARGPLYGVSSHLWSALALAVVYRENYLDAMRREGVA